MMNYIEGLQNIDPITLTLDEMPFYHKDDARHGHAFVRFGNVRQSNNPYFGTQEKICAGQICKVMAPKSTIDEALVVDEKGYLWRVWFSNFEDWNPIRVGKETCYVPC